MEDLIKQSIDSNKVVIDCIHNPNMSRQEIINYLLKVNQGLEKMLNNK